MTCDTSRPCQRCVQRGLDATCEDAPRKKKKYLADVPADIIQQPSRLKSIPLQHNHTVPPGFAPDTAPATGLSSNTILPPLAGGHENGPTDGIALVFGMRHLVSAAGHIPPLRHLPQHLQQQPVKTKKTTFLLSAADLEYSTLSLILQDNFHHANHSTSTEATPTSMVSPVLSPQFHPKGAVDFPFNPSQVAAPGPVNIPGSSTSIGSVPQTRSQMSPLGLVERSSTPSPGENDLATSIGTNSVKLATKIAYNKTGKDDSNVNGNGKGSDGDYVKCDVNINQYFLGPIDTTHIQNFPDVITAIEEMKKSDPALYHERNTKLNLSFVMGEMGGDDDKKSTSGDQHLNLTYRQPEEIYEKVTKPFSYTPGYHQLIAYLRKRFPKEMLVKMAEAMALYRPSFIACTNSLKEGDLIFMEQCFQRTLLTYDNFIHVSGTPTIVWRRTGEIAYVGDEFCVLTGWAREELLSKKKTFIVELLDDKLVLEYFQLFLRIAFGDFLGATMTECTLLTPKLDVKIRTGCMWTLKRDVFGIPMMIIGNFLPIIGE